MLTENAQAMCLVDYQPGTEAVAEVGDLGQRSQLAGHRVDAVHHDHCARTRLEPFQSLGERGDVVVAESRHGAPAGRSTGMHAGMRMSVHEERVARVADGRDQREVGA